METENLKGPQGELPGAEVDLLKEETVAEILIKHLEAMDVSYVFGIPGGFIAPYLKLLRRSKKIDFIIGRHETGCAFMADGLSRMGGGMGVIFVTAGPGALNALNGVACANKGQSSVMLISGQNPTAHFGKGALQESTTDGVNIVETFRHSCAMSELVVGPKALQSRLLQASRLCLGRPRQAVHLSIPMDVSASKLESIPLPTQDELRLPAPYADQELIVRACELMAEAKNPILFVGSGCREALRARPKRLQTLIDWAESLAIPVMTTVQGKGLFPESHQLSLGVHGICGSKQADAYVTGERPDVVMVIGSSLGEWPTKTWDPTWVPSRHLIHVDIDPKSIGKVYPTSLPIVSDAAHAIDSMARALG